MHLWFVIIYAKYLSVYQPKEKSSCRCLCCRIIEPQALKQGNMSSLGFTSKEQRNLGLLVHLMTTNPKILYSPIGSQVDKVIQKVSISSLCDLVSRERMWILYLLMHPFSFCHSLSCTQGRQVAGPEQRPERH